MIKALILHAPGTNRDGDMADAVRLAGAEPVIMPLSILKENGIIFKDYGFLGIPGGFSYGDALGAGNLMALDLKTWFADELQAFVETGKPVIGICNGFQALVKAGILPGGNNTSTLTFNKKGRFECRWVCLSVNRDSPCVFTRGIEQMFLPVAHAEGKVVVTDDGLPDANTVLFYTDEQGNRDSGYPHNPNGSVEDIAGICDQTGRVFALMPHPERFIRGIQHPQWTRRGATEHGDGFRVFQNAVSWAERA